MFEEDWIEKGKEYRKHQTKSDFEKYVNAHQILLRATIEFGIEAIRSLILVNGASVVGLLTFLGAFSKEKLDKPVINSIAHSLLYFAIGVGIALCLSILAYISQSMVIYENEDKTKKERINLKGQILNIICILAGLASTVCFIIGVYWAQTGFFNLSVK